MQAESVRPITAFIANHAEEGFFAAASLYASARQQKESFSTKASLEAWANSVVDAGLLEDSVIQGYCLALQNCPEYYLFVGMDLRESSTNREIFLLPSSVVRKSSFEGQQSLKRGHCENGTPWCADYSSVEIIPAFAQIRKSEHVDASRIDDFKLPKRNLPLLRLLLSGHWSGFYKPLFFYQDANVIIGPSVSALLGHVVRELTSKMPAGHPESNAIEALTGEIESLFNYLNNDFHVMSLDKQDKIQSSRWYIAMRKAVEFHNNHFRTDSADNLYLPDWRYSKRPDSKLGRPFNINQIAYLGAQLLDPSATLRAKPKESDIYRLIEGLNNHDRPKLTAFKEETNKLHPDLWYEGCPYLTTFYASTKFSWDEKMGDLEMFSGQKPENADMVKVNDFELGSLHLLLNWDFSEALSELQELKHFSKQ